jgi:hypothetical protein
VTENDPLHSGSRWEPRPGSGDWAAADVPDDAAAAHPASEFPRGDGGHDRFHERDGDHGGNA